MENNIRAMQHLADLNDVKLRVHIKTHKIPELALKQLKEGAAGIAVAKLGEAEIMAGAGIRDIQVANIIVGPEKIARLLKLHRTCRITVAIDSIENARQLSTAFEKAGRILEVLVEINTGLNRAGLNSYDELLALLKKCQRLKGLSVTGLMTHAGHAYGARSLAEIEKIGRKEGRILVRYAARLKADGFDNVEVVSVGSTPTARFCSAIKGVTELRVGNYIFNDMSQVSLNMASVSDCALTVLSSVVSRPKKSRTVIDAGSKSLALDRGAHGRETIRGFGHIVGGGGEIIRLSEEHGIIENVTRNFKLGQKIRIMPNHACTVMNLFDHAYLVDGNTVLKKYPIAARGKSQ